MVLHIVTLIAALVGESAQTPLHVQCVLQSTPDPWWKWLLPTLVQTIVSSLSIGGGVVIAVWSFRRNRQTEHEQWLRDQRRAEWGDLLDKVGAVSVAMTIDRPKQQMSDSLMNAVIELTQCLDARMFIDQEVLDRSYAGLTECLEMLSDGMLPKERGTEVLTKIRDLTDDLRKTASADVAR